jgi:tryptophan halogenase
MNSADDVIIVGGGDVGLLTALSIRKLNPEMRVLVVDDFQQDIPQVGKSTYREIQNILHGTLEIDEPRFISDVKPIWKASVYFRDWCDYPAFHYPFDPPDKYPAADTPDAIEHYYYLYDELYDSPDHLTKCEEIVSQAKSPWYYQSNGDLDRYDKVAYHLNTERFNSFLQEFCQERGISLVDDEITAVETTNTHIDRVRSEHQHYEADLYIDATGFNRVLRGEQGVEFRDFEFPLDSAFNVRIDRSLSDVIPATIVETGDHGWFWHIDTYDNRDLGYVFASEYADEAVLDEFLAYVESVAPGDQSVSEADVDKYEFTSGYYDRAWVDNCLAIGNAEGFVEPLQSTALTANASLAVLFSNLLSSHGRIVDNDLQEAYNTSVRRTWESIHDFISAHYKYSSGDTEFWQTMGSMEVSPRVERIAEEFDRYGYDWNIDTENTDTLAELKIFEVPDFYTVIRNMGATSEFYEKNDFEVSDDVVREENQSYQNTREQVEDHHLTVRELYKGIMNF